MNLDDARAAAQKFHNFFKVFDGINEFVESVNQLITLKKEAETSISSLRTESTELKGLIATNRQILTKLQTGVDDSRKQAKVEIETWRSEVATEIASSKRISADEIAKDKVKALGKIEQAKGVFARELEDHQSKITDLDKLIQDKQRNIEQLVNAASNAESRLKEAQNKLGVIKASL